MNEYEKMIRGYWYDANFDTALIAMRLRAEELCFRFNHTSPAKTEERQRILNELLPHMQEQVTILSPFHVDYGAHCQIGEGTFLNHNAYLMDGGRITIGARCFIGPNCGIYTARHPLCSLIRLRWAIPAETSVPFRRATASDKIQIHSKVSFGSLFSFSFGVIVDITP